ncbi:hypothetical protein H3Z85_02455 [Chryseobacterium indologenes]|uniref:hypothetical protein n=1 Tax=Chryseobacterium TaxID=59732 RepID=UPI0004846F2D|nr:MULTISPECIES: hypothetical protein [Chryseobacterium]QIX81909.1 hypothetical protein FOB56_12005 [Chryseobacterium indologenes]QPQ52377.1 hypothetical protein H3Z85_02455 [Chryseobacterium indologenes]UDQ55682.1 hypothetical protein LJF28_08465 [Chryseobacterium indologenes]SFJ86921.1 hypothetical protein SAMN05421692_2786 [Chryseobacterium indologenes]SUX51009.1 Uncharacterised protein [Chryseobacterium indologenes]
MQEKNFILLCMFFLIFGHAQQGGVGIGNTAPNSSAILDVTSTNKGFQLPVVSLTSTADISTVQAPKRGFVIYNTAVAGTGMSSVNKGLYVFNGTAWEKMFTKANIITEVEKIPFITPVFAASNIATSSSIAGGTTTGLTFNTLFKNLPAGVQGPAGAYTGYQIKENGMYVITYNVDTRNTTGDINGSSALFVQKNGATVCTYAMERDYQFAGLSSTCTLELVIGDTISFSVQSNGTNYQIGNTNVSISKILNN